MGRKTKKSACVNIKDEDKCTLPCKPVRDRKTRKFLHCRTAISLEKLKKDKPFVLNEIYKDQEDRDFVKDLFRKVVLNHTTFEKEIENKK